jgi:hypothetical protein
MVEFPYRVAISLLRLLWHGDMNSHVIVWDIETIPDLRGFAAGNGLAGKRDEEVREATGDKFPKHIYHSIVCIGALVARREDDHATRYAPPSTLGSMRPKLLRGRTTPLARQAALCVRRFPRCPAHPRRRQQPLSPSLRP